MTEYKTQVRPNDYVIWFSTDDYEKYLIVQNTCRDMIDNVQAQFCKNCKYCVESERIAGEFLCERLWKKITPDWYCHDWRKNEQTL